MLNPCGVSLLYPPPPCLSLTFQNKYIQFCYLVSDSEGNLDPLLAISKNSPTLNIIEDPIVESSTLKTPARIQNELAKC